VRHFRVARWFLFKPKIIILRNLGGPYIDWNILICIVYGLFYRHLGYFMTLWYILCSFGTFFPVLVSCTEKNLATLLHCETQDDWVLRWLALNADDSSGSSVYKLLCQPPPPKIQSPDIHTPRAHLLMKCENNYNY
jgi:hypothetical protein